jgi:hypothetical protein
MLFPMSAWCILPRGWGLGRNMWSSYIGPNHGTIQFAVMDFSKSPTSNMRCWAFTWRPSTQRITYAHAKDDASIMRNFDSYSLPFNGAFTEKEEILASDGTPYDDSRTFSLPQYALTSLNDSIANLVEKTNKYDSSYKLRNSDGSQIEDFTKSTLFTSETGLMRRFINHGTARAASKALGKTVTQFTEVPEHKDALDMILVYLSASISSSEYQKQKEKNQPTLPDTFILPFIKPRANSQIPYPITTGELAEYIMAVLKGAKSFDEKSINTFIKTTSFLMKAIYRTYSADRSDSKKKLYYYQLEDCIDALTVNFKFIDILQIPIGGVEKSILELKVEDTEDILKFIESNIR